MLSSILSSTRYRRSNREIRVGGRSMFFVMGHLGSDQIGGTSDYGTASTGSKAAEEGWTYCTWIRQDWQRPGWTFER